MLRDQGTGFVAQGFNFSIGYPTKVVLGDFDGDGITDLATGKLSGAIGTGLRLAGDVVPRRAGSRCARGPRAASIG